MISLLRLLLLLLWTASTTLATEEAPLVAVYAVRGQTVHLPCNLTSQPADPVILVLWYKNGTKTPVFSVDSRPRGQQKGAGSSRSSDFFRGRADIHQHQGWRWTLVVRNVEFRDHGEYRCRLDFQSSPTHNARVQLHVVDLPQQLRIYSPGGALVEDVAVVQEGHPLTLSCRATGGQPLPNVTWWSGSTLLDSEVEESQESRPSLTTPTITPTASYATNTLRLDAVTRAHITHNLTCRAANTPVLSSLKASVLLREIDTELKVEMETPAGKLSGGRQYDMRCEASGVRPPPVLTWWLRDQQLTHNIHVQSLGVDSTVSLLRLLATAGDDGGLLECRAAAPTLPHLSATDSIRLTVHYVPEATITIAGVGGGGEVGGFRAGDSATLVCTARANPPAYNVTFMFNGRALLRSNLVRSDWNLTLLHLGHQDVGLYTCVASNPEGDGQSNAVALHIDYAPVCEWEGAREVLAVVGEKVEMECRVRASPPQVSYTWESLIVSNSMNQVRTSLQHHDTGLTSSGWMKADNVSSGAQRAECQPSNEVGSADRPCVFTILLVEPPSTLIGCYYHDVTTDSAAVTCSPGPTSSQLPEIFHIESSPLINLLLPPSELLTTFSPGPVVVTQLNPGRSSRRASTLSAPGGSSPRDFHRRAPSVSGDPVHVLEVEDDDITTPRVEIHSPSRLPRINLTSEDLKGQDSPPLLSLRCEPLQQALSQARPQVSPQPELESGSSEQQAETHTALDAETQTGDLELSPEAHAQHFTQSHSLTQTHPMTHIHSIPQVYPTPQVHSTPQVQSTPEVHPTTHIHPTTYIHPTTQVHQTHQAQPSCQVQSTSQAHPTTLVHLTPQTHSTTHLHSQLQTDTLLAIQSSTATLPHTATLPRSTFKSHHTGTTPQLALLSQPALSQQHTGAVPRPATHAYTGTASQQCATTLPRGLTLSQLASQVHSVPQDTSWHQCQPTPQQLSAPQAHLLLRPPENEPPAHHQPQAQPLTLTERSLHPDSVTHQHLIPPDNTSINLFTTFR
nr:hemicentin-1-like [Cherax quadricarinatus]